MLKQLLVGTAIGDRAISERSRIDLIFAAMRRSENLGTIINDLVAGAILARICAPGTVFIDVGAHIGSVVDAVQRHSHASKVIAFEAIPEKVAALRTKFPRVTVHECALGQDTTDITFYVDEERSGYSSLDAEITHRSANVRPITVPLRRLDDLLDEDAVDVIKIDVEGAELGVLMGGEGTIKRCRPTIMFESGAGTMGSYSKQRMWEWLNEREYAILLPVRVPHKDDGMSLSSFEESHLYPRLTTNYFAVHRSRREEVMSRARLVMELD